MAKPRPVDSNSSHKIQQKRVKGQKAAELPVAVPSNPVGDKNAQMLCIALMVGFSAIFLGGLAFSGFQLYSSLMKAEYVGIFFGAVGIIVTVLIGRALLWLTFLLPIMYASKQNAFVAEEALSKKALGLRKIVPTAGSTAAVMLVQSYIKRGAYQEALDFAEAQYQEHTADKKYLQALAPVFSAAAFSCQTLGKTKESIVWNDRAIEAFEGIQAQMGQKKGLIAKFIPQQDAQVLGSITTQMSLSHFSNGNCYFTQRNFRQAKEHYRKSIDIAMQAPDFPEKSDMIKAAKEQLSRLKHA